MRLKVNILAFACCLGVFGCGSLNTEDLLNIPYIFIMTDGAPGTDPACSSTLDLETDTEVGSFSLDEILQAAGTARNKLKEVSVSSIKVEGTAISGQTSDFSLNSTVFLSSHTFSSNSETVNTAGGPNLVVEAQSSPFNLTYNLGACVDVTNIEVTVEFRGISISD